MKVILVPMYLTLKELENQSIIPDASVEAEHGEQEIEGKTCRRTSWD